MKYLTHNGHQLMTKNKLEKAVKDYLKSMDRILTADAPSPANIKKEILDHIQLLNEQHPRCTPIRASWYKTLDNDWLLSGVHFCSFMIYHVKTEH